MRLIKWLFWALVLVVIAGVSFAISQPESNMAAPFRGLAVKTLEIGSSGMEMLLSSRTVNATREYSKISNALRTMAAIEGITDLPEVKSPSGDLTSFPSRDNPLYPAYIDEPECQFRYTIDSQDQLVMSTEGTQVDSSLKGILEKLNWLKSVSSNPELRKKLVLNKGP